MNDIITIDGPAGSGKSTVSRLLAERLKYRYLDTGAMYRAVSVAVTRAGIKWENEAATEKICNTIDIRFSQEGDVNRIFLGDEDITEAIRDPSIDLMASNISTLDSVRQAMVRLQKQIGDQGRLVAEGRDMGTVVFPEARYKFYLDADLEIRVSRRFIERQQRGELLPKEEVMKELASRDYQDKNRRLSPLKPALDAKVIDTTKLSINQVVEKIIEEIGK